MTTKSQVGFIGRRGRIWVLIASWFVPVIMTIAYVVLALTSETDASGWAWMSLGLAFVLVLWFIFRTLTQSAALARAAAVGDTDRLLELTSAQLERRRRGRAPFLVYRALAREIRGEWPQALSTIAEITDPTPPLRALAATVQITALVETGEVARAREVLDRELEPTVARLDGRMEATAHIRTWLSRARVLLAEGKPAEAAAQAQRVADDIRTGAVVRDAAKQLLAKSRA